MTLAVGVGDQDARPCLGLLDHVGQVMAIIFGERGAKDNQIKDLPPQQILHLVATLRWSDLVSRFFDRNRLCSKDFRITFRIQNLQS